MVGLAMLGSKGGWVKGWWSRCGVVIGSRGGGGRKGSRDDTG